MVSTSPARRLTKRLFGLALAALPLLAVAFSPNPAFAGQTGAFADQTDTSAARHLRGAGQAEAFADQTDTSAARHLRGADAGYARRSASYCDKGQVLRNGVCIERRAAAKKKSTFNKAAVAAAKKPTWPIILGAVGGAAALVLLSQDDDDPAPAPTSPAPPTTDTCDPPKMRDNNGQCVDPPAPPTTVTCTPPQVLNPTTQMCENPTPPPSNCPSGQIEDDAGFCRAPPLDPPPTVTCSSGQIAIWGQCVTPSTLPTAATSLTFWENTSGAAAHGFVGQPALKVVKAHYAYGDSLAAGFDGSGIQTAVVDYGVRKIHAFHDNDGTDASGTGNVGDPFTCPQGKTLLGDRKCYTFTRLTRVNQVNYRNTDVVVPDSRVYNFDGAEHGSVVASILAGYQPNNPPPNLGFGGTPAAGTQSFQGIAYRANVLDVPYGPLERQFQRAYCQVSGNTCRFAEDYGILAASIGAAASHSSNPRYINVSIGIKDYFSDLVPRVGNRASQEIQLRKVALLDAILGNGKTPITRPVFVVSAGNDYPTDTSPSGPGTCITVAVSASYPCATPYQSNPSFLGRLPRAALGTGGREYPLDTDIRPWFLVVVATNLPDTDNPQGTIANFSNRCGDSAEWCVAAPGVGIRGAQSGGSARAEASGTSFAAPLVTGAMALLDEAFSTAHGSSLAPRDIRRRLLDTADRTGIYAHANGPADAAANGIDPDDNREGAIYGQGLLDVQAALTPQGSGTVPGPSGAARQHVRGRGLPVEGLGFALPASARQALGEAQLMTLDAHGFPFYLRAADLVQGAAPSSLASMTVRAAPQVMHKGLGLSVGNDAGWATALLPRHMRAGFAGLARGGARSWRGAAPVAAGAHLGVSPLLASSLSLGAARHVALQAQVGQLTLGAMACGRQQHVRSQQAALRDINVSSCMALAWDWHPGKDFGLSLRTHRLDTRNGLYRYGLLCGPGACADGSATATEVGLGGFAKVSPNLHLGWNYWRGAADDGAAGAGVLSYGDVRHSGGSLALGDGDGTWRLYLQQPLRTAGRLAVRLPSHRTPDGQVRFRSYDFALRGPRHLRLGFSGRLALTRKGGFVHLDLGGEQGLDGLGGTHPYASLEARIPW